jgi:hypothetical protein
MNPFLYDEKPVTNNLSYDMAASEGEGCLEGSTRFTGDQNHNEGLVYLTFINSSRRTRKNNPADHKAKKAVPCF